MWRKRNICTLLVGMYNNVTTVDISQKPKTRTTL